MTLAVSRSRPRDTTRLGRGLHCVAEEYECEDALRTFFTGLFTCQAVFM